MRRGRLPSVELSQERYEKVKEAYSNRLCSCCGHSKSLRDIAKEFNISSPMVSYIIKGEVGTNRNKR